jgi:Domain of unknown function (DUF4382)
MNRIHTKNTQLLILLAVALLGFLVAGCSQDADPLIPESPIELSGDEQGGTLTIKLSETPIVQDDIILVLVGIAAHRDVGDELDGWYEMEFEPTEFSFQDLSTGVSALITDAALPTGTYNQLRLLLGEGNQVIIDGEAFDLIVYPGLRSGIKLRHLFEIAEGEPYTVTLDFDASRSVTQTGSGTYILRPVLRAIECIAAGAITGSINPPDAEAKVWTMYGGETIECFADLHTGDFTLVGLPAGAYTINITPAPGRWYPSIAILGIEVSAGETTDLGIVTLMVPVN